MKILVTLDFPPEKGGIQHYLDAIVRHTFTPNDLVIAAGIYTGPTDDVKRYPCRIIRCHTPQFVGNKKLMLVSMLQVLIFQLLKNRGKATVYAGNIYSALLPWLISRVAPLTFHVYCYGTELIPLSENRSMWASVGKRVLRRAEVVYYLTRVTLELIESVAGRGRYVQMVPRIDLPDYALSKKRSEDGYVQLLSVGRLVRHKGHDVLVRAVAGLPDRYKWRLSIVGNGPEYTALVSLVKKYALEDNVAFYTGMPEDELINCYKNADIFILSSIAGRSGVEGFGIVLLEAMAFGAAIVASQSGGIAEVVEGERDAAILVAPGDPGRLTAALEELLTDENRRWTLVRNARRLLEERYVW